MNCFLSDQIKCYLDGTLSPSESIRLETHVENCSMCQDQLALSLAAEAAEEDDFAGIDWSKELPIRATFTDEVMSQLVQGPQKQPFPASDPPAKTWKRRSWEIMKKVTIAAAGLALAISLGTFVSPSFAEYVHSLFQTGDSDKGMSQAVEQGFVKQLGLKSTDQGITLAAKEVLADMMRIAIIFEVRDEKGNPIDVVFDDNAHLQASFRDQAGNEILGERNGGWTIQKHGEYVMFKRELIDIVSEGIPIPDVFSIHLQYEQIGDKTGNWQLKIPVDMAKAKAASTIVPIDKPFTTPQGMSIRFKQMEFAPSASLLTLETELTPQVRAKIEETIKKNRLKTEMERGKPTMSYYIGSQLAHYDFAYELVDQNGQIVAAWDPLLDGDLSIEKNTIINGITGKGSSDSDKMTWWHTFEPMKPAEPLTLKMYAVYTNELADFRIKLDAAELAGGKVVKATDSAGNSFAFSGFAKEKDRRGQDYYAVNVEGILAKGNVSADVWAVTDEQGKEQPVSISKTSASWTEDGRVKFQGTLRLRELPEETKSFTVSYGILQKQHRDVHFELPIVGKN